MLLLAVCDSSCCFQAAVLQADRAHRGHGALPVPDDVAGQQRAACDAGGAGGHGQDLRGRERAGAAQPQVLQRPQRQHVRAGVWRGRAVTLSRDGA